MTMINSNKALVEGLVKSGALESPLLIRAFLLVDRKIFVPPERQSEAYADYPLPIGFGQTISQPSTVAFMLEKLAPRPGDRVLEIGSGSGYVLALLAYVVGVKGEVFGIERLPELVVKANRSFRAAKIKGITITVGDGAGGLPAHAPFDRIIVSAAPQTVPPALLEQLNNKGKLVLPVGGESLQDIVVISKKGSVLRKESFSGFRFVPFV